jgi:hypothetical protein
MEPENESAAVEPAEPAAEPVVEARPPESAAAAGRDEGGTYLIFELHLDADGSVSARQVDRLASKIYDRATVLRLAAFKAKGAAKDQSLFVVVDPGKRSIAVLAAGSGRPVKPGVALRAKRRLAELSPQALVKHKTSRRPLSPVVRRIATRTRARTFGKTRRSR